MKLFRLDISVSEKRNPTIQSRSLNEDLVLKSWGTVFVSFGKSHLFPSSFCLEHPTVTVYIDPLLVGDGLPADYIFITHAHPDHFSLPDIARLTHDKTLIICPKEVAKKLPGYHVLLVNPGDQLRWRTLSCDVVPAYSIGFPSHPKREKNVGYILTIDDCRIYHAGDTDLIKPLKALKDIDVALVPIDGGILTMKTHEAARLINRMKPNQVIPMHYVVDKAKPQAFEALITPPIEVVIFAD